MSSNTFKTMRARLVATALAAGVFVPGTNAVFADVAGGDAKLLRGDYEEARAEYSKAAGKERDQGQLGLARVNLRTGKYDDALQGAKKLAASKNPDVAVDGTILVAEVYRLRGKYAEARRELQPLSGAGQRHLRARYLLGLVYLDLGQPGRAQPVFKAIADDWSSGTLDQDSADQIYYVAQAARYLAALDETGWYDDANVMFRDAISLDANHLEANVEWGYMLLGEYSAGPASESFDEVLKIDPHNPDANAGMAMAKLEQQYDIAGARHHLEEALKANPRHMGALLVRAALAIDMNRWDEASATLKQVLDVNPMNFEAHSLLATIAWLRDDTEAYEREKKIVLTANPGYAAFFHTVARSAEREHRYTQAIELEKEAVAANPKYYVAMQAIGTGYLRLGLEKEGLNWLRKAWKGDEYNARTLNTLELFEKTLPREYSFSNTKYFKFRYPNKGKESLERTIEPVLTAAFEDMVKRYGFTPNHPIVIELFNDPEDYSVRTVGLPNLGALGVCFGQVITAMSPLGSDINWGMVLWHELSHVFAIQLSNSRVPRWYTEGLSEYETLIARPEWRRENDADIWAAMAEGTLPSVAELNYGFLKPSMREIVVTYHLSSVTIEYIAGAYGFDKLVEGLRLFGQGKETPAVIATITGRTVAEFDAEFRVFLNKRLAPYQGSFRVPTELASLTELEVAAAAAPKDSKALADLALGHFFDADATKAEMVARKALAIDSKNLISLYILAELALRQQDLDGAEKLYIELIAKGGDCFDVRGRLATIAKRKGEIEEAEAQLCAAKKLDPERSYPYMELAEIYKSTGKTALALAELEGYVMIEQMQYAPLKELVDGYVAGQNWPKVRIYGELAVFINPADAELWIDLGNAYFHSDAHEKALFSFASALVAQPQLRRPALGHIGRAQVYLATGQRAKGLAAIKKALATEPANADALKLRALLRNK